jgi:single-strand DNA-binding protein
MNKVIIIGRLTKDAEVRYGGHNNTAVARYTLAVDRKFKTEGQPTADFINCIAFGKLGEFAEKYLHKGVKIAVTGRIQTGSYTGKDGNKVYTTDVVVEEQEFCESKNASQQNNNTQPAPQTSGNDFMSIPDNIESELPFN